MSKLAALALSATILAAPLAAQDSQLVRMRARADSLLRSWREAALLADVADSLERVRATAGADTITVGGLRIIANRSPLPLRQAAERAWPIVDSLYGSAALELLNRPWIIRAVDPDTAVPRTVLHEGLEIPWDLDLNQTTTMLLSTVGAPRLDQRLLDWLSAVPRPAWNEEQGARNVYVQLVTAPSEAVRRCFLDEISRCRDVLQLDDSADLLSRWYITPAEREALVTGAFGDYFARPATAPTLQRCREHDDDACVRLLRALPTLPPPLFHGPRMLLLREALRAGGRDAYSRLVADPSAPIGARLASAAAIPLDSLVARWRARALAARPASLVVPWWAGVFAMVWTAIFALCASRSSRWRL